MMVQRGPQEDAQQYFDVLRAMLFYIDEFPERLHHPKESDLLFPEGRPRAVPSTMAAIQRLEKGSPARRGGRAGAPASAAGLGTAGRLAPASFEDAAKTYVNFYLDHMRVEETEILPAAGRSCSPGLGRISTPPLLPIQDPLSGRQPRDPQYDRLFTRIVMSARRNRSGWVQTTEGCASSVG